jgi:hypothetical protein
MNDLWTIGLFGFDTGWGSGDGFSSEHGKRLLPGESLCLGKLRKPPRAVRIYILVIEIEVALARALLRFVDDKDGDCWKAPIEGPIRKITHPLDIQALSRCSANVIQFKRGQDTRVRGECFEIIQIDRRSAID